MKIVAYYDFNGGKAAVEKRYPTEYREIQNVISAIDASTCKTKISREITMAEKVLYSPQDLNKAFKSGFSQYQWANHKEICDYKYGTYLPGYVPSRCATHSKPFRDMDFVKQGKKLGVEVQFGKYAFMVYNVCAKMTIFRNLGIIDVGVEIVPVKCFADEMSTGVSYFEQFAWDLEHRGIADIDVPVLILGIDT